MSSGQDGENSLNSSGLWELVKGDCSMNNSGSEGESENEMVPLVAANDQEVDVETKTTTNVVVPSAPEMDLVQSAEDEKVSETYDTKTTAAIASVLVEEVASINEDASSPAGSVSAGGGEGEVNVGASVAAGAVTGLLVGGPFLSLLAACGASFYVRKEGAAGDVVRAGGDIALAIKDRAQKINEKHDLMAKAKESMRDLRRRFGEYDEEHNVLQQISNYLYSLGSKVVEFERNHHLVENVFICISRGVARLADKLNKHEEEADETTY